MSTTTLASPVAVPENDGSVSFESLGGCFSVTCIFLPASITFAQAPRQTSSALKKPLLYQIGEMVHINAGGPRPLLQAVDALQQKYGWVVDYEDPRYLPAADAANRTSPPNRRRANIGPGENGFSVQFNVGPTPDSRPDEGTVLTTVIDAYNESGGEAEFKALKQPGAGFAVVGVGVRDTTGEIASQQPVLDLSINLASERRSAEQTIALICHELSQTSKVPVAVDPASGNLHKKASVVVGGSSVPARTLLSRTLVSLGGKLCWRLLYDAAGNSYALSIQELSR